MSVEFEMAPASSSIIMVAGIGGGGGNAVNHLYNLGNASVAFMVCNTDRQALDRSPVPIKIQFGNGLGAGNRPEKARAAAMESMEEIKESLTTNDTKMLFVTAGMGGGTGTGAAPVVAQIAKDLGILTVGIVSIPFKSEGPKRVAQAVAGIEELSHSVDSLVVINNEHIAQIYGKLGISQALAKADDILAMAAKSIADIITAYYAVNVDFADVTTVMKESGVAMMGSATGGGEDRAMEVAKAAINSPLLHHNSIKGARNVLLNMTYGTEELSFEESKQIIDYIQDLSELDYQTDVIWGAGKDETLGSDIRVTVVATGFDVKSIPAIKEHYKLTPSAPAPKEPQREVITWGDDSEPVKKEVRKEADMGDFTVVTHNNGAAKETETETPVRIEANEVKTPDLRHHNRVVLSPTEAGESTMIDVEDSKVETPAWMRRKFDLYNEPRNPSVKRENLDSTPIETAPTENVSLFD